MATTEPLSHTAHGVPMVAHEWLAQIAYYLVTKVVGVLGLRWIHAGITAVVVLLVYFMLRREKASGALALGGAFLYFVVAHNRFQVRPHMFDLLFFASMYGYVFVVKPELTGRQLLALFATIVVWANTHSGAVLMATLLVVYAVVETLQQKLGWRDSEAGDPGRGNLKRLAILSGSSVLALALTPNHLRLFPYLLESKRVNSLYSQEWAPITDFWGRHTMKPFAVEAYWFLLSLTILAAILALVRRRSLSQVAIVLLLGGMPLTGQRFVAGCFVPIIYVLGSFARWSSKGMGGTVPAHRRTAAAVCTIAAIGLVLGMSYPVLGPSFKRFRNRLTSEWDFRAAYFPVGAVKFLEQTRLEGNLYHPARWGGYVAWKLPDVPIFVDGRWVTFGQVHLDDDTIRLKRAAAFSVLDKYEIDIVLIFREWMTDEDLARHGWVRVFENFSAGVYIRSGGPGESNLLRCAEYYKGVGVPFSLESGFSEKEAYYANRTWSTEFEIRRTHLNRPGRQPRQVRGF
jgi:hypothetical protein